MKNTNLKLASMQRNLNLLLGLRKREMKINKLKNKLHQIKEKKL